MLIESDFFAGEQLRWNLGWASPNYAGAFVAVLLALSFILSDSRWRWGFLVIELGGFFLLAKTYSRGALVAWGAAWLFGVLSTRVPRKTRWLWLARIVALATILYSADFQWSRAKNPSSTVTMEGDRSVGNRLALWVGGLKLMAAAPLQGWGAGESGRAYQNWFQDLEREEHFTTMVNSYLSVAVERGLPILGGLLFILSVPAVCAWKLARTGNSCAMAAGAGLVAWLCANIFSTLWLEWRLWVVPGLAYTFLAWSIWQRRHELLGPIIFTGALVVATTTALYITGAALLRREVLAISPSAEGVVIASKTEAATEWHAWADSTVLGEFYGKELRRCVLESGVPLRLVVRPPSGKSGAALPDSAAGVILFGKQAARARLHLSAAHEVLLIHPTTPPPDVVEIPSRRVAVIFPETDEVGNRQAWERWAATQGGTFVVSKDSGLDIRSVWPEILCEAEGGERRK